MKYRRPTPVTVPLEHDGRHEDCPPCRIIRSRRAVLLTRALHNPEGLTAYQFTRGMTKNDSLAFWTDARALGLVSVGVNSRGTKVFALPSEAEKP